MTLYLSIAVVLFSLACLRMCGALDRRYEKSIVLLLTILAFAFSFSRWETGTDWDSYFNAYRKMVHISDMLAQRWWGPGYSLIAIALNSFHASFSVFLMAVAAILFAVKYQMLKRTCAAPLVAIFVLFCTDFFGIYFVRESVAVAFFWAFTYSYFKRRYVCACTAAVCAVAFHYSAGLPIVLVLIVTNLKWRRVFILGPLAAAAVYLFIAGSYATNIISVTDLGAYVGTSFVEEKASVLSTTVRDYLKIAFWLAVAGATYGAFLKRSTSDFSEQYGRLCMNSAVVILAATAALLLISEVFARLPEYSLPLFAVALSNYRFRLGRLTVSGAVYLAAISMLFGELYFLFSGYARFYYPIRTIFGST